MKEHRRKRKREKRGRGRQRIRKIRGESGRREEGRMDEEKIGRKQGKGKGGMENWRRGRESTVGIGREG